MAKIKLTAQEMKRQKDELKRFRRFLPTLTLKKLQIQIETNRVRMDLQKKTAEDTVRMKAFDEWIAVLGEEMGLEDLVVVDPAVREETNVAGVDIPVFKGLRFKERTYDLFFTPLWVDRAIEELRTLLTLRAEISVLKEQKERLEMELRTTVQRVNLFEKVKIPEAVENIRKIQIFIGEQQAAAVVRGKIAKSKVEQRNAALIQGESAGP